MTQIFWTPEEIELLTINYPLIGIKPCAKLLGRSESSIAKKARRIGVKAPSVKKSDKQYRQDLFSIDSMLTPIEEYAGANTPILHVCAEGHRTKIRPSNILSGISNGCSICANRFTRTTEEYSKQIPFKVLESYKKSDTPILHECLEGHTWLAAPHNILRGRGCPSCAIYGFNPDKPGMLYYIKFFKDNQTYYKIGITNRSIKERFNKDKDLEIIVLYEHTFSTGKEAKELESSILEEFKHLKLENAQVLNSGGNTELFNSDILGFDI